MAKTKTSKPDPLGGKHRHLKSRISYLYRAAQLLTDSNPVVAEPSVNNAKTIPNVSKDSTDPLTSTRLPAPSSTRLLSELRSVALKSQIRLSNIPIPDSIPESSDPLKPNVKSHICRRCSSLLIPRDSNPTSSQGKQTCEISIENKSRGQRKPWADVQVVRCQICGWEKRVPIGAQRQKKRKERENMKDNSKGNTPKLSKEPIKRSNESMELGNG